MPAELRPGSDHEHHPWSALAGRPSSGWPGGSPLAVSVIVVLDSIDPVREALDPRPPRAVGGMGIRPAPDLARISHREYGLRVGAFRVFDALDRHGIPATVAFDLATARRARRLVEHVVARGDEIAAAGRSASEPLGSWCTEREEQEYVAEVLAGIEQATGSRPRGWIGPGYGESARGPAVLAAAGLEYVCDWANDEQPYAMTTPVGSLTALPVALELDTEHAFWERRLPAATWATAVERAVARLVVDGATHARSLVVVLRPWLVGQPFRVAALDRALGSLAAIPAWCATASEVVAAAGGWWDRG